MSTTLLARQIAEIFRKLAERINIVVKGSFDNTDTVRTLYKIYSVIKEPWDILVGTPGRIVTTLKKDGEAAKNVAYVSFEETLVVNFRW